MVRCLQVLITPAIDAVESLVSAVDQGSCVDIGHGSEGIIWRQTSGRIAKDIIDLDLLRFI